MAGATSGFDLYMTKILFALHQLDGDTVLEVQLILERLLAAKCTKAVALEMLRQLLST